MEEWKESTLREIQGIKPASFLTARTCRLNEREWKWVSDTQISSWDTGEMVAVYSLSCQVEFGHDSTVKGGVIQEMSIKRFWKHVWSLGQWLDQTQSWGSWA